MIKLNDDSIFVGQIKQILKDFNLPNCPTGRINARKDKHFIEDNNIYKVLEVNGKIKIEKVSNYTLGDKYPNLTSNFTINNLIYDRDTHRYLGRYLRFLRDYQSIDLMSMYNCFDQEVFNRNLVFNLDEETIIFENNKTHIVYSVPVSRELLTIKTHKRLNAEVCLTLDIDNPKISELLKVLAAKTLIKINTGNATLYENIFNFKKYTNQEEITTRLIGEVLDNSFALLAEDSDTEIMKKCANLIATYPDALRLLIKVPKSVQTSIVVLEGDFVNKSGQYYTYKDIETGEILETKFDINPQLLSHLNYKGNYIIADRIIEYLTNNVITPISEFYDIAKLQRYLLKHKLVKRDSIGIWSQEDTIAIKKLIQKVELDKAYDTLPYLDKDLESKTGGEII